MNATERGRRIEGRPDRDPLAQRIRIGELCGQIGDLEAEGTEETVQRITTENTTLKQRIRQLTTDNRTLDERLKAARSNLRFQDRRVADLETRIADGWGSPSAVVITRECEDVVRAKTLGTYWFVLAW